MRGKFQGTDQRIIALIFVYVLEQTTDLLWQKAEPSACIKSRILFFRDNTSGFPILQERSGKEVSVQQRYKKHDHGKDQEAANDLSAETDGHAAAIRAPADPPHRE